MDPNCKEKLASIFQAGLDAVEPEAAVRRHFKRKDEQLVVQGNRYDLNGFNRIALVGAGKAAAPMARAVEQVLKERLDQGHIIVKYDHGMTLTRTNVFEAGHPVPDDAGWQATGKVVRCVTEMGADDLVIVVLSGGGSALLTAPTGGIDLADKQRTTELLLASGATITEINTIRKHISLAKGGLLAKAATPATVITLILSDVVGDPLNVIASGPTVADESTFSDCIDIIQRYGIESKLPQAVHRRLFTGAKGEVDETPKMDDPVWEKVQNIVVGNNRMALEAAAKKADGLGYQTLILTSQLQGEAKEVAQVVAAMGREIAHHQTPLTPPACMLLGGETTVTLTGTGQGGRNQELALAAALALEGTQKTYLLSAGSDGTDGPTVAAGAFADGQTCMRARKKGLDPYEFLAQNDSYAFFKPLGDLLITGPTRTNVMDLVILLVLHQS